MVNGVFGNAGKELSLQAHYSRPITSIQQILIEICFVKIVYISWYLSFSTYSIAIYYIILSQISIYNSICYILENNLGRLASVIEHHHRDPTS